MIGNFGVNNIKLFCNYLPILLFAHLLVGCGASLIRDREAQAREDIASEQAVVSPPNSSTSAPSPISDSSDLMYKMLIGEVAAQRGEYVLAAQNFLAVATKTHDEELAERATRFALFAQDKELALNATTLWASLAPNNPQVKQILTGLLLKQGQIDQAVANLEKLLDSFKDDAQQQQDAVSALLEQEEDKNKNFSFLKKLVEIRPKDTSILLLYARLLIDNNQFDVAQPILQKILAINSSHEQAALLYAHILEKQNKTKEAIQWLKQQIDKNANENWQFLYARLLATDEQYDESIRQFKQLLTKHPQRSEFLYALGLLYLQTKQLQPAKKYFTSLLSNNNQRDTAIFYLGRIAETEKSFEDALLWYKKVQKGDNYLNAQARIASIYAERNQLDKAIEHLQSVPVENNQDAIALIQLGAELFIQKQLLNDAMTLYNRALESDPESTDLLYTRAMLADKMGNFEQFEKDLRAILEINPKDVEALNALGYGLADKTERYQEAQTLIKQALELRPTAYHILDSMGWVLYRLGQYDQALEYLNKVKKIQDDAEVNAHLVEVLWAKGNKADAKALFEETFKRYPQDERVLKVKDKLFK
jgi:tetratricopeptide (TPR) repeat protein